jgi:predicted ATPase
MVSASEIAFGPFCMLPNERLLLKSGKPIRLGSRAFDILSVLLARSGELVPKRELIARVWPDTTVGEANLTVHMTTLRRALAAHGATDRFIVNVPGRGYVLTASIATTTYRSNLPAPTAHLVGRAGAVRALTALLSQKRFVTIVGEGGIGKTSVALAVGQRAMDAFEQGVHFFDLTSITDGRQLSKQLANWFAPEASQEDPIRCIRLALKDARLLVVLDNCEHVVDVAAALAQAILRSCPGVHILATSREPLRAEGECVYRLPALDVPPPSLCVSARETLLYSAAQMFADCVAGRLGEFDLADRDAPFVGVICQRLEGLPLGIELAAGRVGTLGVQGLAASLEKGLDILMRGCRRDVPRHQSLKSSLDWSYALLSEDERRILARLVVFEDSFTVNAARAVLSDGRLAAGEFVDVLAELVTKSLVIALDQGGLEPRFCLRQATRAYARRDFAALDDEKAIRHHDERSLSDTSIVGSTSSIAWPASYSGMWG